MSDQSQPGVLTRSFRISGDILAGTAKYALIILLIMAGAWITGRIMETANGNAVFDPVLTYWLGIASWILLSIWITGSAVGFVKEMSMAEKKGPAVLPWVFLLLVLAFVIYDLEGFQISSSGLLAILSGSEGPSQRASVLLFKFHPFNPMLVANLVALKFKGPADFESLAPHVWQWNTLFFFFLWSFVYGIFLLMLKKDIWPKILYLILAAFCLEILILLKSKSPVAGQMVWLHASALMLIVFQIMLTYSSLRSLAALKKEMPEKYDPFDIHPVEGKAPANTPPGLPPSAIKVVLFLFIILPILADQYHQFKMAAPAAEILSESTGYRGSALNSAVITWNNWRGIIEKRF